MSDRMLTTQSGLPFRTKTWADGDYAGLDEGIRFVVRLLHARGFETCQSCQGGDGHAYDRPTVDLVAGSSDAIGFGAVDVCVGYGLSVRDVALVWNIDKGGLPYERLWRITFWSTMDERADEVPMFVWGSTINAAKGAHQ